MNDPHLHNKYYYQNGLSIVELMIALALGLLLISGIVHLFVGSKSTNNMLQGLSQIQENGRISIERLKMDLRMAGHMGCSNFGVTVPNPIVPEAIFPFELNSVIQGIENALAGNPDDAVAGTDVLTIITASAADSVLQGNMAAENSDIKITDNPNQFQAGDTLVISDCENTDIFVASDVINSTTETTIKHSRNFEADGTTATQNSSDKLSKAYRDNAMIMSVQQVSYAIQDTGRVDNAGNAIMSLFKTPRGGTAIEIITGVEDMQLTYGLDTGSNGTADIYDTADNITAAQWGNVVSVRIALLISTAADVGREKHPYTFNGTKEYFPADNRLRREFVTTVNLRNRNS